MSALEMLAFNLLLLLALTGYSIAEKDGTQHLVAFRCHWPAVHLTDDGWTSDNSTGCLSRPDDILKYCKKVYSSLDVRNLVELHSTVNVTNWCDFAGKNCAQDFVVQPFQCLIGSFEAIDLTVPDECVADRIVDSRMCKSSRDWKSDAVGSCRERVMKVEKLSVMEPCDIGQFSGIQFVCCPSDVDMSVEVVNRWPALISEGESTAASPSVKVATSDAAAEPENEHGRYIRVRAELHMHHDEEISRIMDAWDEAQQAVSEMRLKDPDMADKLERKITARFQKTISSLEEREESEKRQIDSIHERNVQQELNQRKRKAMEAYMAVLSRQPPAAMRDILQVLKHYVRVEQKDRMHVINHYIHLEETDAAGAESIRAIVAERLRSIKLRLKRALDMLNRVPAYKSDISRKIQDILEEYDGFDNLEASIVNAVVNDRSTTKSKTEKVDDSRTSFGDNKVQDNDNNVNNERQHQEGTRSGTGGNGLRIVEETEKIAEEFRELEDGKEGEFEKSVFDGSEIDEIVDTKPAVHPSHLDTSDLRLGERKYFKSKRQTGSAVGTLVLIIATSVFFVTVAILGVVVWRRYVETRRIRSRLRDDSRLLVAPEQVHVTNMQVNGYENPTYKYFETKPTN